jgi:hypothetical protein
MPGPSDAGVRNFLGRKYFSERKVLKTIIIFGRIGLYKPVIAQQSRIPRLLTENWNQLP